MRSAARAGEEHDFVRRAGTRRQVRIDGAATAVGITVEALRACVAAGTFSPMPDANTP